MTSKWRERPHRHVGGRSWSSSWFCYYVQLRSCAAFIASLIHFVNEQLVLTKDLNRLGVCKSAELSSMKEAAVFQLVLIQDLSRFHVCKVCRTVFNEGRRCLS